MLIVRGTGYIEFDDRREYFEVGDTIHIKPYEKHTIVASRTRFCMKLPRHF